MNILIQKHKPMHMKNIYNTYDNGMTLLEVMITILILSIGMLGTAALIGGIIRGNETSNHITTATVIAQDKMEDFDRKGYDSTRTSDRTYTEAYNSISNYPGYRRTTILKVNNPIEGMQKVTVKVYWNFIGKEKSVDLITFFSK